MKRIIAIAVGILTVSSLLLSGCSNLAGGTGSPTAPARPKIVREASLASKWEMRHISLDVNAGEELPVMLKLSDGDKVDGFFYLESGSNVDFRVMGNTQVYALQATDATKVITSDRFSFNATQAQGQSYTLLFKNPAVGADKAKVTVFLELVYPNKGSIYTLLESK